MTAILLATDSDAVFDQVDAALGGPGHTVSRVHRGRDVRAAVGELEPDVVVLDLQIGNMGGVATALDLRHEAGADRLPDTTIVLLLDRQADVFLARESGADDWVVKPIDAFVLRRTVETLLDAAADDALR